MIRHVYSDIPWLIPEECAALAELFREKGTPVAIRVKTVLNFGEEPKVYFVEKGLIATFSSAIGRDERLVALFSSGTAFGAEKSVRSKFNPKPLIARALLPVKAYMLDAPQFRRALEADPELYIRVMHSFLRHDDAKIEGLLMNDLLTVPERLACMIEVLFLAEKMPLSDFPRCLPKAVSVTELARLVHSSRAVVSRILSGWAAEGRITENGGVYFFTRRLTEDAVS